VLTHAACRQTILLTPIQTEEKFLP